MNPCSRIPAAMPPLANVIAAAALLALGACADMSPKGRPEREYRSAQHAGSSITAKGRPKRELFPRGGKARSAKVFQ